MNSNSFLINNTPINNTTTSTIASSSLSSSSTSSSSNFIINGRNDLGIFKTNNNNNVNKFVSDVILIDDDDELSTNDSDDDQQQQQHQHIENYKNESFHYNKNNNFLSHSNVAISGNSSVSLVEVIELSSNSSSDDEQEKVSINLNKFVPPIYFNNNLDDHNEGDEKMYEDNNNNDDDDIIEISASSFHGPSKPRQSRFVESSSASLYHKPSTSAGYCKSSIFSTKCMQIQQTRTATTTMSNVPLYMNNYYEYYGYQSNQVQFMDVINEVTRSMVNVVEDELRNEYNIDDDDNNNNGDEDGNDNLNQGHHNPLQSYISILTPPQTSLGTTTQLTIMEHTPSYTPPISPNYFSDVEDNNNNNNQELNSHRSRMLKAPSNAFQKRNSLKRKDADHYFANLKRVRYYSDSDSDIEEIPAESFVGPSKVRGSIFIPGTKILAKLNEKSTTI